ncbi:DUF2357 domain-containing protein [Salipaludibacillus daqingensis]|uniref:DUF2357 domain-containing protein n=1 Tax=Salipaludibacillus daqingensis TaxID=3041001 RepID=UPI00247713B3|nr:DUF2357 domain-containing protein [Salipaludibacillus daqingensis]
MAQRSIGDDVMIRVPGEEWIPLNESYLMEGATYEWHLSRKRANDLRFANIPLTYQMVDDGLTGSIVTPFQSGEITFSVDDEEYRMYLYPDSRKMTETQYDQMLIEILQEAAVCFQYAGSTRTLEHSGFQRDMSWSQWQYIITTFSNLSLLMGKLVQRPLRVLHNRTEFVRRETVKSLSPQTERWLEQTYGKGNQEGVPEQLKTSIREENIDVYENRLIKSQLRQLEQLLLRYYECGYKEVETEANRLLARVRYWLSHTFLREVSELTGSRVITQVFRKHPTYKLIYQWFERLFRHGQLHVGFGYSIPLKNTFDLYEMWCYFQVMKSCRKSGLLQDTSSLYRIENDGIFLDLSVNHQSKVSLNNGWKLYFQRVYQGNSPLFFTYTHRMIPDIVLEGSKEMVVFDPKYRVPANLSNAIGEMHKYRDGILSKKSGSRAVREVYVMTPWQDGQYIPKFFNEDYQEQHRMGAIVMNPGEQQEWLDEWIRKKMTEL